jgi:hypothetical protein
MQPGAAYVLRAADSRVAVAVLLERDEVPEIGSSRFSNLSPISYALARADAENLDYVVMLTGPAIRLYPVRVGVGTGRRGRSETYAEIRLDLLPEDQASYLWLIFSAAALRKNGTVQQILETSARYAADLGSRLRDRIYDEVVPPLAQGLMVARNLRLPTAKDLADTYENALVILFRLLFIAYAEDKELLPYKTNEFYRDRSLKKKASAGRGRQDSYGPRQCPRDWIAEWRAFASEPTAQPETGRILLLTWHQPKRIL